METIIESHAEVVFPTTPAGYQPTNITLTVGITALPPKVILPAPIPSETPSQNFVCSPIAGFSPDELINSIVNPYNPPPRGSDNPHQGVDIAEIGEGMYALEGAPVEAVLSGKVAGVIDDRFPYGNAVLIETPLDLLPANLVSSLSLPESGLPLEELPSLYCPNDLSDAIIKTEGQSIYIIYAHMRDTSKFMPGDQIQCEQEIGAVGNTGNSINPHLHLEIRVGPSKAILASMAHYDLSATIEEMNNYCLWRISGVFKTINPGNLLDKISDY